MNATAAASITFVNSIRPNRSPIAWAARADEILLSLWPGEPTAAMISEAVSAVTSPFRSESAVYGRARTLGLPPKKRGGDRRSETKVDPVPVYHRRCLTCSASFATNERYIFACTPCHAGEEWIAGVNDDPYEFGTE